MSDSLRTPPTAPRDTYFHGVCAPAWADSSRLAEILREEAADERHWFGTDRDKALLLTAADRIEELEAELAAKDALVADLKHWIGASM